MATLFEHPTLAKSLGTHGPRDSYSGPVEIDAKPPPKARPILAEISVDGVAIAEAEVPAEAQNHPAENPGAALLEAARALVIRELLLQEARRLELAPSPEAAAVGRTEAPDDAAIRLLIEQEVSVPSATEEECRRFHANHPERFCSAAIFDARHILLAAAPEDAPARRAARAEADAVIAHLRREPSDFAALALAHSACPSKQQGGNLGQLTQGSTVPEFERALQTMSAGEIRAAPVESRFGFHVIALDRTIPGASLPYEAVRERIAGWLEAASWSKAVAQYIAVLAGRARIHGIDIAAADGPLIQ